MTSESISRGRFQGAAAVALVVAATFMIAAAVLGPGLSPAATCSSPTCVIPVAARTTLGLGGWQCNLQLSSEVTVPAGVTEIKWNLTTAGYSFVDGGHAVSVLNDAGDFAAGAGSSKREFRLSRPSAPVAARVYRYSINVESDDGKYCMVPTLPRIKNE